MRYKTAFRRERLGFILRFAGKAFVFNYSNFHNFFNFKKALL